MNKPAGLTEAHTKLLLETIRKNEWARAEQTLALQTWVNFHQSPEVLRNYLCKDGSGYIRGYYDGSGTFYIQRFHLRDEEWADPFATQS